jgi:hypothetical protein
MCGTRSIHGQIQIRAVAKKIFGKPETDHLIDLGVDERTILNWILIKEDLGVCIVYLLRTILESYLTICGALDDLVVAC